MTKLVTNKFRTHIVQQFVESFTEAANNIYYLAAGRHTEYPEGDDNVPTPVDTVDDVFVLPYQEAIFGKKIQNADVAFMAPRHDWTANTFYSQYDNQDSTLIDKQYYVVVDRGSYYYVYKVLDNNGGAASTVQPTNTSETACNFITTADGYKWKLMYRLTEDEFEKFATEEYMPVRTSANVSAAAVSGAIDNIIVNEPGANYVAVLEGSFNIEDLRDNIPTITGNTLTYRLTSNSSSNSDFYTGSAIYLTSGTGAGQLRKVINYSSNTRVITVNGAFTTPPSVDTRYIISPDVLINGDGSSAAAYATVASNSTVSNYISKINVVNRGSGYTYATATIVGNTAGLSTTANCRVIIPPKGGHGADSIIELGATSVGISVKYSNNESGYIPTENDFRTLYVMRDPLFDGVTFTVGDVEGTFTEDEPIHQVEYKYLRGSIVADASTTDIVGTSTEFDKALKVGDNIIVADTANPYYSLRRVVAITNSEHITVNSAPSFSTLAGKIAFTDITGSGIRTGNTLPYMGATNVTPTFATNKQIIGAESGAIATITDINVTGKNYNNWGTFDNRTRISYTSNTGAMANDVTVYQLSSLLSNAIFHSSNSSYVTLTSEKGVINADPADPLIAVNDSLKSFTLGSVKYGPDIVKGSGEIIYIENKDPVQRSNNQTETIKIILNF